MCGGVCSAFAGPKFGDSRNRPPKVGAKKITPHTLRIEIECETLAQVEEARDAGADIIMLDNMSIDMMKRARQLVGDKIILEASGNVNLDTVRAIAETGVDLISVGAITHSARAMDISMRIVS